MSGAMSGAARRFRFRDLPIQRKLLLLVLFASGIALLLAGVGVVVFEVTTVRPRVMRDLQTQADLLRANTTAALSFQDPQAAIENLATLRAKPEIEAAALYDGAGRRFAEYRSTDHAHIAPPAHSPAMGGADDGTHLLFTVPISSDGEVLGRLALWYELPPLWARLPQYGIMVGVVLLTLLAVGLLLAAMLRAALTGPLAALARTAREVTATQNYAARAAKRGADEIGDLTDAVNGMLGTIEARDAALRRRTTQLRDVMDAARMASWSWWPARDRVVWGEEAGELLGLGPEARESTFAGFLALVHPDDRPRVADALRVAAANERSPVVLFRACNPEEAERAFELQAWAAPHDAGEQEPQLIGLVQDVTERERSEEARRTWADAFEHAALGIAISDPATGRVRYANPSFATMYGRVPEELRDAPIRSFYAPAEWEGALAYTAVADATGNVTFESVHVRADGTEFPVEVTLTTVRDGDGLPRYRIANVQDLTDQQRLEEQFRQAQKMEAVGRLAGGIAHDFNNLLTGIEGYSGFALRRLGPDHPVRGDLEEVRRIGRRAAMLTQQLLAFSRRQVLQPSIVEPNELIVNLSKLLGRLLGEDIDIAVRTDPRVGRIEVDPAQLEQALVNLAVNARDAMPQGGRLTIETQNAVLTPAHAATEPDVVPGDYVLLAVTDTGHGMSREVQRRVFEPFFTTKPVGKGTGLGLAQVFGLVKQSGGHVTAYSELGRGTTFKIYLPRIAAAAPDAAEDTPLAPPPGGSETVLVVEDQPEVLLLAVRELRELGYTVHEAANADDALALADRTEGPIHLLVTDVVMPGRNGRELAEALCARRPELRRLYMSGYPDDAIVHQGVLHPDTPFLQKPFTAEQLAVKVREALDRAR